MRNGSIIYSKGNCWEGRAYHIATHCQRREGQTAPLVENEKRSIEINKERRLWLEQKNKPSESRPTATGSEKETARLRPTYSCPPAVPASGDITPLRALTDPDIIRNLFY